jgi:hypothetical protein
MRGTPADVHVRRWPRQQGYLPARYPLAPRVKLPADDGILAANAILTFNAGECVRRARLVMIPAPLSGHQAALARGSPLIGLSDYSGPPLTASGGQSSRVVIRGTDLSMQYGEFELWMGFHPEGDLIIPQKAVIGMAEGSFASLTFKDSLRAPEGFKIQAASLQFLAEPDQAGIIDAISDRRPEFGDDTAGAPFPIAYQRTRFRTKKYISE